MRYLPNVLLVLSLPAGVLGYALGVRIVEAISLPAGVAGIVQLFVPLLIGGLFMMPFLIPFVDRKAKQDLADYRRIQAASKPGPDADKVD